MWVLGGHHVDHGRRGLDLHRRLQQRRGNGPRVLDPLPRAGALRAPPLARDADLVDAGDLGTLARSARGPGRAHRSGRGHVATGLILGPVRVLLPMRLGIPGPAPHAFAEGAPVNPGLVVAWLISSGVLSAFWVLGIVFLLILARGVVRSRLARRPRRDPLLLGDLPGRLRTGRDASARVPLHGNSGGRRRSASESSPRSSPRPAGASSATRIYSSDPSSWIFYAGMIAVAAVLALAYWATKTALAGRPLFGSAEES